MPGAKSSLIYDSPNRNLVCEANQIPELSPGFDLDVCSVWNATKRSFGAPSDRTLADSAKERSRMQPGLILPEVLEQGQSDSRKTARHPTESERIRYGNTGRGLKDRAESVP